jgi:DNA-binding MarR family transcriptional regulator
VRRHAHPRDGRSTLLSLEPETVERASECYAPLVAELDALIGRLTEAEQAVALRFLERVAEAGERHAEALAARADAAHARPIAPPSPGLWS